MTGRTNLFKLTFNILFKYRYYCVVLFYWYLDKHPSILDISPYIFQYFISAFKLNYLVSPPRPPAQPHLIPNPTRSFDHNWDFPKAFWKESRRLLIAAVLSLTAGWSCQTICSISHGKQYKLIYGLPGWHNSPERLKAFLNLSTLWESLWASEAKDNCAHLSQSCWSERKESTIHLYCCLPISPQHQHIILQPLGGPEHHLTQQTSRLV